MTQIDDMCTDFFIFAASSGGFFHFYQVREGPDAAWDTFASDNSNIEKFTACLSGEYDFRIRSAFPRRSLDLLGLVPLDRGLRPRFMRASNGPASHGGRW